MAPGMITNRCDESVGDQLNINPKHKLNFGLKKNEVEYGSVKKIELEESPEGGRSELYGYALMITGCFFFDIVSTIGRATMIFHGLSSANFIFLRGTSHLVYCLLWTFAFYDWREVFYVPPEMRGLLFVRAALGGIAIALCYYALSMTPLVVIVSVLFLGTLLLWTPSPPPHSITNPLADPIYTLILSAVFLGERISVREACAASLSICGVILVANPELKLPQNLPRMYLLGLCLQVIAGILFAIQVVVVRVLSKKVHYMTTTISMGIPIALIGWAQGGADLPGFNFGVRLALFGCFFGFIAFVLIHKSLKYSRASTAALMQNVDLPFAYAMGVVFLGEVPHIASLFGTVLVICGCIGVALDTRRKENEKAAQELTERINEDTV